VIGSLAASARLQTVAARQPYLLNGSGQLVCSKASLVAGQLGTRSTAMTERPNNSFKPNPLRGSA
jgi:hypothetical protein